MPARSAQRGALPCPALRCAALPCAQESNTEQNTVLDANICFALLRRLCPAERREYVPQAVREGRVRRATQ